MSVILYTASRKTPFLHPTDYEVNVADQKMALFDIARCRLVWKEIAQTIHKLVKESTSPRPLVILIRCEHGLHRSVQTAERLRKEYLNGIHVEVKHLTWEKGAT